MPQGWVRNWRQIEDWEWYKTPNVAHLFQHLIRRANHRKRRWQGIVIETGQLITSQESLRIQTGLSRQSVRTCLDRLKSTSEITIKVTNAYSLITICNYATYQAYSHDDNQPANQRLTNEQPAANQRLTTNKNDKKVKNQKNEKKKRYLEFVLLTDEQHKKLTAKFGEQGCSDRIQNLNDGIGSKGYKYDSHYHTILTWDRTDRKKEENGRSTKNRRNTGFDFPDGDPKDADSIEIST